MEVAVVMVIVEETDAGRKPQIATSIEIEIETWTEVQVAAAAMVEETDEGSVSLSPCRKKAHQSR